MSLISKIFLLSATMMVALLLKVWPDAGACESCDLFVPEDTWNHQDPVLAGFGLEALRELEDEVKGAGCVVYQGRMVYAWGPYDQRADVASLIKPIIVHMVLKAQEDGLIGHLDRPVAEHEPGLRHLNPKLGHKDRAITWRHMMTQTSGYGVKEAPGEAFDYSDKQMALLWTRSFTGSTSPRSNRPRRRFWVPT